MFESFLKVEKTQIFAFLEKTLIHFITQISNLYNVDITFKPNFIYCLNCKD